MDSTKFYFEIMRESYLKKYSEQELAADPRVWSQLLEQYQVRCLVYW